MPPRTLGSDMPWAQIATIATPIIVGILALVGTVYGRSLSKKTDAATARRTDSEATKLDVETARGLVEDVRKLYQEQRAVNTEQRIDYEKRLAVNSSDLQAIAERVRIFESRQTTLLAMLAAHAPWDFAAWSALKEGYPEYPPPPPLDPELADYPRVSLVRNDRSAHQQSSYSSEGE